MSRICEAEPIGGYFALERGVGTGFPWIDGAIGYRSARSALAAVLAALRPEAVWVPNYLCGAVDEALAAVDAKVLRYPLTDSLGVPDKVELDADHLLLVVDYFGTHADAVDAAIARYGAERIVIDASQSLFLGYRAAAATVYSPRKFLGVPDGGWVMASRALPLPEPANEDGSVARSRHLLFRLAGLVDAGYAKFQEAERSLHGCEPEGMSRLTATLLRSSDAEGIAATRTRNYQRLATLLREASLCVPDLPAGAVPLCCPVKCDDAARVRRELISRRVFTPTYWPDAAIPEDDPVALALRDGTVYLPCDQRYGDSAMASVAHSMIESLEAA